MELGSVFLFLALLVLVGIFVSRPILAKEKFAPESSVTREEHEESLMLAERDRILAALKELDFDYALGKIREEDYPKQRNVLLRKGADILRNLDALRSESVGDARALRGIDGIGELPPDSDDVHDMSADDDLEVMLANRRRARQDKSAGFCPKCGAPVQRSDFFCPRCGSKIGIK